VAIRIASLSDSSLVGVKLADNQRVVVAAPAYLKRHGTPRTLDDLARHNCLAISSEGSQRGWTLPAARQDVRPLKVAAIWSATMARCCTTGRSTARAWPGARCGKWARRSTAGELVTVLDKYAAPGNDIYAVFAQRRHLPLRIRAFVDFLRHAYAQPNYWRHPAMTSKRCGSASMFSKPAGRSASRAQRFAGWSR
jgi:DNA-binding transcriptional LysR family regulator